MAARKKDEPEVAPRATPVEAGEPVEAPALSQMGSTFAERAKAVQAAENKAIDSGKTSNKRTRKS